MTEKTFEKGNEVIIPYGITRYNSWKMTYPDYCARLEKEFMKKVKDAIKHNKHYHKTYGMEIIIVIDFEKELGIEK